VHGGHLPAVAGSLLCFTVTGAAGGLHT
jgi:hypothetical protein